MREQKARDAAAAASAEQLRGNRARPPLSTRLATCAGSSWNGLKRRTRACYDGWPALHRVTTHPRFDRLMIWIIVLNTIAMAMEAYGSKVCDKTQYKPTMQSQQTAPSYPAPPQHQFLLPLAPLLLSRSSSRALTLPRPLGTDESDEG